MAAFLLFYPSANFVFLFLNTPFLYHDLGTDIAPFGLIDSAHYQLHATSLASPVLLEAVLAEVAPLVVATSHQVLVVEAHDCLKSVLLSVRLFDHLKRIRGWDIQAHLAVVRNLGVKRWLKSAAGKVKEMMK